MELYVPSIMLGRVQDCKLPNKMRPFTHAVRDEYSWLKVLYLL